MPYPVLVTVETPPGQRNRLTSAPRPILAIPHMVLVGHVQWIRGLPQELLAAAAYFGELVHDSHHRRAPAAGGRIPAVFA
jgi:hypothetical protein